MKFLVVLDLRYEARDIDQRISAPGKIDAWFEAKTKGLTPIAKATLKQRWGTLQRVLSSRDRLEQIANDIIMDMEMKPRLSAGMGNAMLVAGSIPEACKFFEIFRTSGSVLADKCAIVTSYKRAAPEITGEETGMGETEKQYVHRVYTDLLGERENVAEAIENNVRKLIIEEMPVNPRFYEKMSELLTDLIRQRRDDAIEYAEYLERIAALVRDAKAGHGGQYPETITSPGPKALYDNLGGDEALALEVDRAVRETAPFGWRGSAMKERKVRRCLEQVLDDPEAVERVFDILQNHHEY